MSMAASCRIPICRGSDQCRNRLSRPRARRARRASCSDAIADKTPLEVIGRPAPSAALGRPMQTAATLDLSGFSGIALYEPEELVSPRVPARTRAEIEPIARRQAARTSPSSRRTIRRLLGTRACRHARRHARLQSRRAAPHQGGCGARSFSRLRRRFGPRRGLQGRRQVVKNVTGYDLPKLIAGSYGTLAALTSVTFKVLPARRKRGDADPRRPR